MSFRGRKEGILTGAKSLTPGERLLVARERKGIHQDEAARRAGVGEKVYAAAELDRKPFPGRLPALGAVTLPERLGLARRRAKESLTGAALTLSVSRVTYLAMERRGDPALRAFWERRGFRF